MPIAESSQFILVGHVRKPHGVRGEVLVEVLSDAPERFRSGVEFVASGPGFERRLLTVASVRPHRGALLLLFSGFEDRDEAALLRAVDLMVPIEAVAEPPEGSFYYFDLIGRSCRDRRSGDLGEVVAVREDGGGLLLEIRDPSRTVLVPFVREYLISIEEADQPILFDLPEGLLEVCASRS